LRRSQSARFRDASGIWLVACGGADGAAPSRFKWAMFNMAARDIVIGESQ
jgi:hypothetical protein